jgi:hypothetical protein
LLKIASEHIDRDPDGTSETFLPILQSQLAETFNRTHVHNLIKGITLNLLEDSQLSTGDNAGASRSPHKHRLISEIQFIEGLRNDSIEFLGPLRQIQIFGLFEA